MRFEYKVISMKGSMWQGSMPKRDTLFQETLNGLGAQGWELTGVSPYGQYVQAFLKRAK